MSYKIRGNTIYVTGSVDGQHYRLSTGKEANKKNLTWIKRNHRDVLLKLVDKKLNVNKCNTTNFTEFSLNSLENNSSMRRENTNKDFKGIFSRHIQPFFIHFDITEILPSDIKRWQNDLVSKGLMLESIKNCRTVLRSIFMDARLDQIINTNPMELVKLPKGLPTNDIEPFTLDEIELIINNANDWLKNYATVAFLTGMRTGELLALKWGDIDFKSKTILVSRSMTKGVIGPTKTNKNRLIDLLPMVEHCLSMMKPVAKGDWVFTHRLNGPYKEPNTITKSMWKPTLKKCNLKYRKLYNTRHSFATTMLLGGEDLVWVSQMLGHSDVSTTLKYYVKYVPKKRQKRAEFLDKMTHKYCTQEIKNTTQARGNGK